MKNHYRNKIIAAVTAGVLSAAVLSGCAAQKMENTPAPDTSGQAQQEPAQEQTAQYTEVELDVLGMKLALPETLVERMEQDVTVIATANGTQDGQSLQYGQLSWYLMTQEQSELPMGEVDPQDMQLIGVLGVYQTGMEQQLSDLTGCDEHQMLDQSEDGLYQYYLSVDSQADEALLAELRQMQLSVTQMADFAQASEDAGTDSEFAGTSLGEFSTQDIAGEIYTQDVFQDYDLTLVNIFTTWCSPCVAEMPELEELYQQMAEKGVNVIGIVLDAVDENGEIVQQSLQQAQLLVERTGVTYPVLLPDSTFMNGRLSGILAVPETFFVDKNGNIVGQTYTGSGDLAYWTEVVEQELANLKEGV